MSDERGQVLDEVEKVIDRMWSSGDWEGQVSIGFMATLSQEIDHLREVNT